MQLQKFSSGVIPVNFSMSRAIFERLKKLYNRTDPVFDHMLAACADECEKVIMELQLIKLNGKPFKEPEAPVVLKNQDHPVVQVKMPSPGGAALCPNCRKRFITHLSKFCSQCGIGIELF